MCSLLQSNLVLASSNVARTSRRYVFRGAIAIDRSFENHVVRFACVVRFRDGSFFTRAMGIDMNQARMVNDRFHGRKRFRNMWTIRVRGKTSDWFDVVRGLFVPDDAVKIGLSTSLSERFIYHRSPFRVCCCACFLDDFMKYSPILIPLAPSSHWNRSSTTRTCAQLKSAKSTPAAIVQRTITKQNTQRKSIATQAISPMEFIQIADAAEEIGNVATTLFITTLVGLALGFVLLRVESVIEGTD